MATKKNKSLSTSALKSIYSKNYTERKVLVEVEGQTFEVLIQEKFKLSLMQKVIFDLIEAKKYLTDINQAMDYGSYAIYLIIKYFTNLDTSGCDTFEKEIQMLNIMLDMGLIDQIYKHFDEKEIQKINATIKKMSDNVKKLTSDKDAMKEIEGMFAGLKDEEIDLEEVKIETEGVETSESEEITND